MYKLVVNGVVLERLDGEWFVTSPSMEKMKCKDFKTALARMLLEAAPVEWPDGVEDEILDAVRALTKPPKSSVNVIEVDKDHPLMRPPNGNGDVLPHVPGRMLEPVTIPPEEKTLPSFRPEDVGGHVGKLRINMEEE